MRCLPILALALPLATGCGDDSSGVDQSDNDDGSLSARIDGSTFTAFTVSAVYSGGILAIAGARVTPAGTISFAFPVSGPTPVSIGTSSALNAVYTTGSQSWAAFSSTGSGSVTITSLTASRAVGTFSFTMLPNAQSGASGTKTVTNGAFDVTF